LNKRCTLAFEREQELLNPWNLTTISIFQKYNNNNLYLYNGQGECRRGYFKEKGRAALPALPSAFSLVTLTFG
jgi:hypothetical protein